MKPHESLSLSSYRDLWLPRGKMHDADTGEYLPDVHTFDRMSGDYWYYVRDEQGSLQLDPDDPSHALSAHGKVRRLKLVPSDETLPPLYFPPDELT